MVRLLAQTVPCRLVVSPATPGPVSSAPFALLTVFLPGVTVPGASPAVAPWPLRLLWEGSRGCLGWAESPPRARSPQHRGCPTPRLPPPEARSPHRSPTLTHPTNQLCLEARGFISVIFCCSFKSRGNSRPPPCPGLGWEGCRSLLLTPSSQKPAMDSKDEVSDTDSGIILQSGEWVRPPRPRAPQCRVHESWALGPEGRTPEGLGGFPCWGSGREHGSCLGRYL